MAVSQSFRIEVLDCLIQLDRPQAEALFAELAEALGYEDTNLQGALAHLSSQIDSLHRLMAGPGNLPPFDEDVMAGRYDPDEVPSGQTMDIDAYLARQQALAQVGPPAAGGRNPGSGIGNTHVG